MSLTITIHRTEVGRFRAQVAEQPRLVFEHDELPELVEELKRNLDMLVVTPDGRLLVIEPKEANQADEAVARAEIERKALRNDELDELIDRYPVPAEWGNDPEWSDALSGPGFRPTAPARQDQAGALGGSQPRTVLSRASQKTRRGTWRCRWRRCIDPAPARSPNHSQSVSANSATTTAGTTTAAAPNCSLALPGEGRGEGPPPNSQTRSQTLILANSQ